MATKTPKLGLNVTSTTDNIADTINLHLPENAEIMETLFGDYATIKPDLDASVLAAEIINDTLADPVTGTIKLATDADVSLEQAIVDAGVAEDAITNPVTGAIALAETAKSNLDAPITGAIALADAAKDALTNPTTGAIKLANDAETALEDAIAAGNLGNLANLTTTNKADLVGAINELDSDKVDKVTGKQLSTEDYTNAEKVKLAAIFGTEEKTTLVDADTMPLSDSAASHAIKKITWANIKAVLNTLYNLYVHPTTAGNIHLPASGATNNIVVYGGASGTGAWSAMSDTLHGIRGGGSLHADVTTSSDGFMTYTDKLKLDAINISAGTAAPSGGNDGDIYLQYE